MTSLITHPAAFVVRIITGISWNALTATPKCALCIRFITRNFVVHENVVVAKEAIAGAGVFANATRSNFFFQALDFKKALVIAAIHWGKGGAALARNSIGRKGGGWRVAWFLKSKFLIGVDHRKKEKKHWSG
jgi:hypothetical protein